MKADSEPFLPLLKENIDCLFIVPLTNSHVTAKYKNCCRFRIIRIKKFTNYKYAGF